MTSSTIISSSNSSMFLRVYVACLPAVDDDLLFLLFLFCNVCANINIQREREGERKKLQQQQQKLFGYTTQFRRVFSALSLDLGNFSIKPLKRKMQEYSSIDG